MVVRAFRRPSFTRRSAILWVNSIARDIANENGGRVPDIFQIQARIKHGLETDPNRIDLDKLSAAIFKQWDKANHEAIGGLEGKIFVPGAFVAVVRRERVIMRQMRLPADIALWGETERKARESFETVMDRRASYRQERLRASAAHRDCNYLGELEQRCFGFEPKADDDEAHLTGADDDLDIE